MISYEVKNQDSVEVQPTRGGAIIKEDVEELRDVRLGRLEVLIGALDKKIDGAVDLVNQKAQSTDTTVKWALGFIAAMVVGIATILFNGFTAYNNIQNSYYQLLVQDKENIYKTVQNSQMEAFCAKSNSYLDFKSCVTSLVR